MKYSLALLAAVAAFGLFTPTPASAHDHCERRIVGYGPSGYPIYSVYRIYGYDRWGHPLGHWVTESSYGGGYAYGYRDCAPRAPGYGYGYSGYSSRGPVIPLPPLPRPGFGLSLLFGH